jgi:hypothetical protein
MSSRLHWVTLIALAALGCNRKDESPAPPKPTVEAPTTQVSPPDTPTAAPANTAAAQVEVPTEEDFEDEAEREISADNLEAELDKLEREIGQ